MKKVTILKDSNMTKNRQEILNHFKQGHLLELYENLTREQKDKFTQQLEKIPFDIIDMVKLNFLTQKKIIRAFIIW